MRLNSPTNNSAPPVLTVTQTYRQYWEVELGLENRQVEVHSFGGTRTHLRRNTARCHRRFRRGL